MAQRVDPYEAARLYRAGYPVRDIAQRYGVQSPAVTRALNKIGVRLSKGAAKPVRRVSTDDLAQLASEGMGLIAAARELKISESRVFQLWAEIRAGLGAQAV